MPNAEPDLDPVFVHGRREAKWILWIWLGFAAWCTLYSYQFGYTSNPETMTSFWGMPTWVLGGVFLPWILATAVTVVFSLSWMADDDLSGEAVEEVGGGNTPRAGSNKPRHEPDEAAHDA